MRALFTTPLGWCLLIGIIALVVRFWPRRKWIRIAALLLVLAWIAALVPACPLVADAAAAPLEQMGRRWPPSPEWVGREGPDAIVVFGGGLLGRPVPGAPLGPASGERLRAALRAAVRWPEALVVFSGGGRERAVTSAGRMAEEAVALGLAPERVLLETRARTTRGNAVESAALLRARGLSRPALVTSALHLARARGSLWRAGFLAEAVPAPAPVGGNYGPGDLVPRAGALVRTSDALHEALGLAYYRARGWLGPPPVSVSQSDQRRCSVSSHSSVRKRKSQPPLARSRR
jgi:uncharacterized SAM-binding protein YcdF (DUF218 family)